MRLAFAVLVGLAAAALGALILGEYEFTGTTPYVAGVLFGFAIGEVMLMVARHRSVVLGAVAAAASAAGLLWAGFITVRNRNEPIPTEAWIAAAIGLVVGYARAGVAPKRLARPTRSAAPGEEIAGG
jgi:hypothetical protein